MPNELNKIKKIGETNVWLKSQIFRALSHYFSWYSSMQELKAFILKESKWNITTLTAIKLGSAYFNPFCKSWSNKILFYILGHTNSQKSLRNEGHEGPLWNTPEPVWARSKLENSLQVWKLKIFVANFFKDYNWPNLLWLVEYCFFIP